MTSKTTRISDKLSIGGACLYLALGITASVGLVALGNVRQVANADIGEINHYDQELARIDRDIQAWKNAASRQPTSWLRLEKVAKGFLARAQFSGEFDDYVNSVNVLERAFTLAGKSGGPELTRAKLNFSIHRLPGIEVDLVKAESALLVDSNTTQIIAGIRADVLFNTGEYTQAKTAFDQLESSYPNVISATRLAHYHSHIGQYLEAERWFEKAEHRIKGRSAHLRSWMKLQFGILDLQRGRLDDARVHYQQGSAILPGYWLIEEHIAEIDAMQGNNQAAETSYRDLITRTGSPLFMSALASILADSSVVADQYESVSLSEATDKLYETRIEKLPELISGHAIDHYLLTGDIPRALELATRNYELRPGGQAKLLLVQTHSALGHLSEATTMLESLLESPHRSAELHATASVLFRAIQNEGRAEEQALLAIAINPEAITEIEWLQKQVNAAMQSSAVQ